MDRESFLLFTFSSKKLQLAEGTLILHWSVDLLEQKAFTKKLQKFRRSKKNNGSIAENSPKAVNDILVFNTANWLNNIDTPPRKL